MNSHEFIDFEGAACVKFITNGKYQKEVLVDARVWNEYVNRFNWTITMVNKKYPSVHTSIDKLTVKLYRMIIENEYLELDYWGNTIDHINNNPLDNRINNLQIYTSKLNSTNILSKNKNVDMHLIFPQYYQTKKGKVISSYKVHANIFDEVKYRNFPSIEEAKVYRDTELIPYIEKRINDMKKKTRDIEFERGLRDKLAAKEIDEIIEILNKYNFSR